jgi:hypothetical protein
MIFKCVTFKGVCILLIIVGIVFLISSSVQHFHKRAEARSQLCKGDANPVSFKRLSKEQSSPFLKLGRPLSDLQGRSDYGEYKAAVDHFPDVRACLINSERKKHIPDLSLFDWDMIRGEYETEVCLFRIFSSIGSVEGSGRWLKDQGFNVGHISEISTSRMSMRSRHEEEPGIHIAASWPVKECGARIKSNNIFNEILVYFTAYAFSVEADFLADGEVISTSVGYLSE